MQTSTPVLGAYRISICCLIFLFMFLGCGESAPTKNDKFEPNAVGVASNPKEWLDREHPHDHFAEINAPILAIPEAERAWPKYRKVLPALSDINNWQFSLLKPDSGSWQYVASFIEEHKEQIDEVVTISELDKLGFVLEPGISKEDGNAFGMQPSVKKPNAPLGFAILFAVPKLRPTALLLSAAGRQAAARNDNSESLRFYKAALNICRQMEQVPSFAALVATAETYTEVFSSIRRDLQLNPQLWNVEQLEQINALLEKAPLFSFSEVVEFDAFRMVVDGTVKARTAEPTWSGYFNGIGQPFAESTGRFATLEQELDVLERLRTQAITEYSQPIFKRSGPTVLDEVEKIASQTRPKYMFPLLYPALEYPYYAIELVRQDRDATLLTCGLLIHYQKHHRWPNDIHELAPDILSSIPLDRFNGKPFCYMHDSGYVTLYSVAVNREDDDAAPGPITNSTELAKMLGERTAISNSIPGDWIFWEVASNSP